MAEPQGDAPFVSLFGAAPFSLPADCVGLYVNDQHEWRGLAVFDYEVPTYTARVQWNLRFVPC